jgi:hypothetical protein
MLLIGRHRRSSVLVLTVLCACAGCARNPRIEGSVTLDGVPVDGGAISFFQGTGPGSDKGNAAIVGGKYVIEGERARNLTPGSYRVEIYWLQKANADPNSPNADKGAAVKQLIPKKYNGPDSTLTREITQGTNKLDFDLASK